MKRINILIISLCLSLVSFGQLMNERRVYYLDITGSMAGYKGSPDIWDSVVSNLEKAIDNIEDENTEIVIKTFTDAAHPVSTLVSANATETGKEAIKEKLKSVKLVYDCYTDIYVPIQDFYKNEISIANVDYFFLMTDGNQHKTGVSELQKQIQKWNDKTNNGKKHIYGFYVMLTSAAYSEQIEGWIRSQEHFWTVKSANVNINLISVGNIGNRDCVFNARSNTPYVDIPVSGDITHLEFDLVELCDGSYYSISNNEPFADFLRIYINLEKDTTSIPEYVNLPISVKIKKNKRELDILLTEKIDILCENKYVKAINPTFNKGKKIEKLGEVVYYPKFWWSQEKSEELSNVLQLQPSDDAAANNCYVEFEFVDKDGKIIPTSELRIKVDDVLLDRNRFTANCNKDTYTIKFEYTPKAKGGKHQGYLRLVSHNIDRCGNHDLSSCNDCIDVLCWHINYVKKMNPIATGLLIFVIVILGVILLWFVVFCPIIYPRFGSAQKTFTAPGMAPLIVKFKGARLVIVSATPQKKQSLWNRFWTGKVMYKIHPAFTAPIAFKPSKGRRILTKHPIGAYQVMPNPIPYVGTATITDIAKNVKINVN